ncbi:hypothetical protein SAMN05444156_0981 [Verrucomicrobium sp. GAS474]|uniref:hypothetical protein n=1 Tax=Verrucomicrobium sp. GAS474 TaxID=1882831 RepID=UPI00087BA9F2|nr:hypothetical protein [Verrucomicrobium sp. GAS474]SDT94763.1 hypothetical protein SAMN05444156_0981 [Verrucomicrobium sp. GAS474]
MLTRSIRSFWVGLLATLIGASLLLHSWWNPKERHLPAPPPFLPISSSTYLSSANDGELAHCLLLYGLFGTGKRMRDADLLLLGTSHVAMGLSAEILSRRMSAALGRPFRVYNAGLGHAERWAFISQVIQHNQIENQKILFDLYGIRGDGMSPWAEVVRSGNALKSTVLAGNVWSGYMEKWLFYRFVPHISIAQHYAQNPRSDILFYPMQFLDDAYWFRNLETGDTSAFWSPTSGMIYSTAAPPIPNIPNSLVDAAFLEPVIRQNHLTPFLTLIPFLGFNSQEAALEAHAVGHPFIFLNGNGMGYWDGGTHLDSASRDIVTERLFLQMQAEKLDSPLVFPVRKKAK